MVSIWGPFLIRALAALIILWSILEPLIFRNSHILYQHTSTSGLSSNRDWGTAIYISYGSHTKSPAFGTTFAFSKPRETPALLSRLSSIFSFPLLGFRRCRGLEFLAGCKCLRFYAPAICIRTFRLGVGGRDSRLWAVIRWRPA